MQHSPHHTMQRSPAPDSPMRRTLSTSSMRSPSTSNSVKKSVSFKLDTRAPLDVGRWQQPALPPPPPPLPRGLELPPTALHALPDSAQPQHMLASPVRFMLLQRPGEPASARLPVAVKRVSRASWGPVGAVLLQAGPHANVMQLLGVVRLPGGAEQLVVRERLWVDLVDVQGQAPCARELLELALQVARGLEFLHRNGLSHGDVKPENILLSSQGVAKLCDFDMLRHTSWPPDGEYQGTMVYSAPELLPADEAGGGCGARTPASDVWAFGCTLFALFSGSLPFGGNKLAAREAASRTHKHGSPSVPDKVLARFGAQLRSGLRPAVGQLLASDPPLPLALAALIDDCLAREAGERPSMGEVLARLAAVRGTLPMADLPARHLLRLLFACAHDAALVRECGAAFAGRAAAEAARSGGAPFAPTATAVGKLNAEIYEGVLAQHLGDAETCACLVGMLPACASAIPSQPAEAEVLLQKVLPLVVRALQAHVAHAGVCLAAARTVQTIAAVSGEHAGAFARAGAGAALQAAREAHGEGSGVGAAAGAALAELEVRGAQRGGCCSVA